MGNITELIDFNITGADTENGAPINVEHGREATIGIEMTSHADTCYVYIQHSHNQTEWITIAYVKYESGDGTDGETCTLKAPTFDYLRAQVVTGGNAVGKVRIQYN